MTQPDFPALPLEIKTLIIWELSPYPLSITSCIPDSDKKKAAYFRDLRAVCLAWPDTIAVIRKVIFEKISLRRNDHRIGASLRNLCQALENDRNLAMFVKTLEFSHRDNDSSLPQSSPFIPTSSRPLFISFLSFIPKMHKLKYLRLDNMHFHEDTSIALCDDLRVLKESSVTHLSLRHNTFSISAFNAFLGYWEDMELEELYIDGMSLIPHTTDMSDHIEEDSWDWDEEDTWTEWEVDKPRKACFLFVTDLELQLSEYLGCGTLLLMDFLASHKWSPLADVQSLQIVTDESEAMTATAVIRINNLIRRYKPSSLLLLDFTDFEETIGTPLYLGDVRSVDMDLRIHQDFVVSETDEDRFNWYVESLVTVPPNSRLKELTLCFTIFVPLEGMNLGSQGVWGMLDSALSGDNLQLDTLTVKVQSISSNPSGSKTRGLKELEMWLREICFPRVTAKYFKCSKEEASGRKTSALTVTIGDEF